MHSNVTKLQIFIFLSSEQLINLISLTNNKYGIKSSCALNDFTFSELSKFHIEIEPSKQPQAF